MSISQLVLKVVGGMTALTAVSVGGYLAKDYIFNTEELTNEDKEAIGKESGWTAEPANGGTATLTGTDPNKTATFTVTVSLANNNWSCKIKGITTSTTESSITVSQTRIADKLNGQDKKSNREWFVKNCVKNQKEITLELTNNSSEWSLKNLDQIFTQEHINKFGVEYKTQEELKDTDKTKWKCKYTEGANAHEHFEYGVSGATSHTCLHKSDTKYSGKSITCEKLD